MIQRIHILPGYWRTPRARRGFQKYGRPRYKFRVLRIIAQGIARMGRRFRLCSSSVPMQPYG